MQKLLHLKNKWIFLAFLLIARGSQAQTRSDWDLVANATFKNETFEKKREVSYLFAGKNAFVKYNPLSLVFGGLLFVYQKTISVQIGAACPYEVSCSSFSKACIQKYGLIKGIPLTADRLTRCNRLAMLGMVDGVDYSSRRMKIFDHPDDYSRHKK